MSDLDDLTLPIVLLNNQELFAQRHEVDREGRFRINVGNRANLDLSSWNHAVNCFVQRVEEQFTEELS